MIEAAERIAHQAERELEALVAVSTPSGDVAGAEEAVALCVAFLPPEARVERVACSTAGHAPDLLGRLEGSGTLRVLLLGHLDTVVSHSAHRALVRDGDRLTGSGSVDMKGGVALALGLMRELAPRPELYAELSVLLVNDEEWRTARFEHADRFADFHACLCFEAGERTAGGEEAVIVKRKAAATLRVDAYGRPAHSGSAPHKGRSALLALAAVAQTIAAHHDPHGADRLTAVPTIFRSGEAFNVVPPAGRADLRRARRPPGRVHAGDRVAAGGDRRGEAGGDARSGLARDGHALGRRAPAGEGERGAGAPIVASERGGASDASHMAAAIGLTVDGLGPRGGGAHTPQEWVSAKSLHSRAEVALGVAAALLEGPSQGPRR